MPTQNRDPKPVTSSVVEQLASFAASFDRRFAECLAPVEFVPDRLLEAVRYAALGPGKRLRPFLVIRSAELVGAVTETVWTAAAAIECLHAFSLVHDDLPAMDDDDLRRGRPTCHKQFDEATAVLAGDALVVLAFELIVRAAHDRSQGMRMVAELARGAGWTGLVGGQMSDLMETSQPPSIERVESIHVRKTARLFETACRIGGITVGGDDHRIAALGAYGLDLGRAFQITDDLLDVLSTPERVGKKTGKDDRGGKQTYPACIGIEGSRQAVRDAIATAKRALRGFGPAADDLCRLADYVADRNY